MSSLRRFLYELSRLRWQITRPLTLGVRLILLRDGQVLLVRHTYQDGWYLPGGGVRRGETIEQAARREAHEEVGADLGPLRLLGMYTNFFESKSDHVAVFACEDFTLDGSSDGEIAGTGFFPLAALPAGIRPGHARRVAEYLAGPTTARFGPW